MAEQVKAGVVTGEDYLKVVRAAKAGGYALPAVNVVGTNSINAVLEAATKAKSDVIIQLSDSGAQFYAGKGYPDSTEAKILELCQRHSMFIYSLNAMASVLCFTPTMRIRS